MRHVSTGLGSRRLQCKYCQIPMPTISKLFTFDACMLLRHKPLSEMLVHANITIGHKLPSATFFVLHFCTCILWVHTLSLFLKTRVEN